MISSAPILTVSAVFDAVILRKCFVILQWVYSCSWYLNYFQVMGVTLEFNGFIVTKFPSSFSEKTELV